MNRRYGCDVYLVVPSREWFEDHARLWHRMTYSMDGKTAWCLTCSDIRTFAPPPIMPRDGEFIGE